MIVFVAYRREGFKALRNVSTPRAIGYPALVSTLVEVGCWSIKSRLLTYHT